MRKRVYVETTIISVLTARPSRDVILIARQELTRDWWETRQQDYELYVSRVVVEEVGAGDPKAARRRLEAIEGLPGLVLTDEITEIAKALVADGVIPSGAATDALHLAIAAVHGMDFLLTWNCRHLANAAMQRLIQTAVEECGYESPVICTPEELFGESG